MDEDEKSENQIVSLGDLLRDGISVSSLAMSIKDKEKKISITTIASDALSLQVRLKKPLRSSF